MPGRGTDIRRMDRGRNAEGVDTMNGKGRMGRRVVAFLLAALLCLSAAPVPIWADGTDGSAAAIEGDGLTGVAVGVEGGARAATFEAKSVNDMEIVINHSIDADGNDVGTFRDGYGQYNLGDFENLGSCVKTAQIQSPIRNDDYYWRDIMNFQYSFGFYKEFAIRFTFQVFPKRFDPKGEIPSHWFKWKMDYVQLDAKERFCGDFVLDGTDTVIGYYYVDMDGWIYVMFNENVDTKEYVDISLGFNASWDTSNDDPSIKFEFDDGKTSKPIALDRNRSSQGKTSYSVANGKFSYYAYLTANDDLEVRKICDRFIIGDAKTAAFVESFLNARPGTTLADYLRLDEVKYRFGGWSSDKYENIDITGSNLTLERNEKPVDLQSGLYTLYTDKKMETVLNVGGAPFVDKVISADMHELFMLTPGLYRVKRTKDANTAEVDGPIYDISVTSDDAIMVGRNLAGGRYDVYSDSTMTKLVKSDFAVSTDLHELSGLPAGRYYLKKVSGGTSDRVMYTVHVSNNNLAMANLGTALVGSTCSVYADKDLTSLVKSGVKVSSDLHELANLNGGTYYVKRTRTEKDKIADGPIYKIDVTRSDVAVSALNGSTYTLYSDADMSKGHIVRENIVISDGASAFTDLAAKTYYMKQIRDADNHLVDGKVYTVTKGTDGSVSVLMNSVSGTEFIVSVSKKAVSAVVPVGIDHVENGYVSSAGVDWTKAGMHWDLDLSGSPIDVLEGQTLYVYYTFSVDDELMRAMYQQENSALGFINALKFGMDKDYRQTVSASLSSMSTSTPVSKVLDYDMSSVRKWFTLRFNNLGYIPEHALITDKLNPKNDPILSQLTNSLEFDTSPDAACSFKPSAGAGLNYTPVIRRSPSQAHFDNLTWEAAAVQNPDGQSDIWVSPDGTRFKFFLPSKADWGSVGTYALRYPVKWSKEALEALNAQGNVAAYVNGVEFEDEAYDYEPPGYIPRTKEPEITKTANSVALGDDGNMHIEWSVTAKVKGDGKDERSFHFYDKLPCGSATGGYVIDGLADWKLTSSNVVSPETWDAMDENARQEAIAAGKFRAEYLGRFDREFYWPTYYESWYTDWYKFTDLDELKRATGIDVLVEYTDSEEIRPLDHVNVGYHVHSSHSCEVLIALYSEDVPFDRPVLGRASYSESIGYMVDNGRDYNVTITYDTKLPSSYLDSPTHRNDVELAYDIYGTEGKQDYAKKNTWASRAFKESDLKSKVTLTNQVVDRQVDLGEDYQYLTYKIVLDMRECKASPPTAMYDSITDLEGVKFKPGSVRAYLVNDPSTFDVAAPGNDVLGKKLGSDGSIIGDDAGGTVLVKQASLNDKNMRFTLDWSEYVNGNDSDGLTLPSIVFLCDVQVDADELVDVNSTLLTNSATTEDFWGKRRLWATTTDELLTGYVRKVAVTRPSSQNGYKGKYRIDLNVKDYDLSEMTVLNVFDEWTGPLTILTDTIKIYAGTDESNIDAEPLDPKKDYSLRLDDKNHRLTCSINLLADPTDKDSERVEHDFYRVEYDAMVTGLPGQDVEVNNRAYLGGSNPGWSGIKVPATIVASTGSASGQSIKMTIKKFNADNLGDGGLDGASFSLYELNLAETTRLAAMTFQDEKEVESVIAGLASSAWTRVADGTTGTDGPGTGTFSWESGKSYGYGLLSLKSARLYKIVETKAPAGYAMPKDPERYVCFLVGDEKIAGTSYLAYCEPLSLTPTLAIANQKGRLTVHKTDEEVIDLLSGATFNIYKDVVPETVPDGPVPQADAVPDTELVARDVAISTGIAEFGELGAGTYHLVMQENKDGVTLDEGPAYDVAIGGNGAISVLLDGKYRNLSLPGAKFELYMDDPDNGGAKKLFAEGTELSVGVHQFANLDLETTYYLVEAKAPEEYMPDGTEHVVRVDANGDISVDGEPLSDFVFQVTNNKGGYEMPVTGGSGAMGSVLAGSVMALAAAAWFLSRRRRSA